MGTFKRFLSWLSGLVRNQFGYRKSTQVIESEPVELEVTIANEATGESFVQTAKPPPSSTQPRYVMKVNATEVDTQAEFARLFNYVERIRAERDGNAA